MYATDYHLTLASAEDVLKFHYDERSDISMTTCTVLYHTVLETSPLPIPLVLNHHRLSLTVITP